MDCHGKVIRKSIHLRFKTGKSGFIEFLSYTTNELIYISFLENDLIHFDQIEISSCYEFKGLKRCVWGEVNNIDNHSTYWWIVTNEFTYFLCNQRIIDINSQFHNEFIDINSKSDYLSNNFINKTLKLETMYQLSIKEVNIKFIVSKYNENGWIEIYPPRLNIAVFFTHYRDSKCIKLLMKGSIVEIHSVIPLFYKRHLKGFACTVRSHVLCVDNSKMQNNETRDYSQVPSQVPVFLSTRCFIFNVWVFDFYNKILKYSESLINPCVVIQRFIDIASNSIGMSNYKVFDMLLLSPRSVHKEFEDLYYLESNIIRSNQDLDWLSILLPEVSVYSVVYYVGLF